MGFVTHVVLIGRDDEVGQVLGDTADNMYGLSGSLVAYKDSVIVQFDGDAALPRNGSLALGGGAASPIDMAQGYATLANGGHAVKPYVIDAIYGPEGETLYRNEPAVVCDECVVEGSPLAVYELRTREMSLDEMAGVALDYKPDASVAPQLFADMNIAPQVISPQNAFIVQDMMRDVVRRGTGRRQCRPARRAHLRG